jgi:ABC-2 type transport system ATP-binding protein
VLVEGSPGELIEAMGADVVQIQGTGDQAAFEARLREAEFVQSLTTGEGLVQAGVDSGSRRLVDVVRSAGEAGFKIEDISVAKPALGDVFLKFTGRQFRD